MTTHDDCTHAKTASARAACRRQRSGEEARPRTEADARKDHPAGKRRGLRKGEETTAERRVREGFAKDGQGPPPNVPGRDTCPHDQVVRNYFDAIKPSEDGGKPVRTRVARYLCQGEDCGKVSHVPYGSILSMTRLREDNGTAAETTS